MTSTHEAIPFEHYDRNDVLYRRTLRQIFRDLTDRLDEDGLGRELEYFDLNGVVEHTQAHISASSVVPMDMHWISCYVVTGASEGHYIHIDFIMDDQSRRSVMLGKTFEGWDHAWTVAKRCAELLGA
jgi:hypothetical protein